MKHGSRFIFLVLFCFDYIAFIKWNFTPLAIAINMNCGVVPHFDASSRRCGPHYYSHENTVEGDLDFDDDLSGYEPTDEEDALEAIRIVMESKLTQIIRFNCNELYDRLEEEYERATTTDAIIKEIKNAWPGCNFRKDGTIFARKKRRKNGKNTTIKIRRYL